MLDEIIFTGTQYINAGKYVKFIRISTSYLTKALMRNFYLHNAEIGTRWNLIYLASMWPHSGQIEDEPHILSEHRVARIKVLIGAMARGKYRQIQKAALYEDAWTVSPENTGNIYIREFAAVAAAGLGDIVALKGFTTTEKFHPTNEFLSLPWQLQLSMEDTTHLCIFGKMLSLHACINISSKSFILQHAPSAVQIS